MALPPNQKYYCPCCKWLWALSDIAAPFPGLATCPATGQASQDIDWEPEFPTLFVPEPRTPEQKAIANHQLAYYRRQAAQSADLLAYEIGIPITLTR